MSHVDKREENLMYRSSFYPYNRKQAVDIICEYWTNMTRKEANKYLLDLIQSPEAQSDRDYVGNFLTMLKEFNSAQAKLAFYND